MRPLTFLLIGLLVGCVPEEPADDDTAGDDDTSGDDDASGGCADVVDPGLTVWIDEDGPDTQIHAAAAADGDGIWVAYNRPRDDGYFDVFVKRLACDGSVEVAPIRLNEDDGANHVDPAVAVSRDRLLVTWHRDDGQYPYNMSVHLAVISQTGDVPTADQRLVTTHDGAEHEGNVWMPSAAALPDGGFVVAGSRGHPVYEQFQVFAQRLDADGAPDGETIDLHDDPDASQTAPAVGAVDGALVVAWSRTDWEAGTDEVWGAAVPAGADAAGAAAPLAVDETSYTPAANAGTYAYTVEGAGGASIAVQLADDPGTRLALAEPGRYLHTPTLAADGDRGAVAWYAMISGLDNDLQVARLDLSGGAPDELHRLTMDTGTPVPPYPPALTHLVDDVWFLAWSEGDNPDYRVRGGFVDLAP